MCLAAKFVSSTFCVSQLGMCDIDDLNAAIKCHRNGIISLLPWPVTRQAKGLKHRMNRCKGWVEYMSDLTLTELSLAFFLLSLWNKQWVLTVQGQSPIKWNFIKRTWSFHSSCLPFSTFGWISTKIICWRFIRIYFNLWFTIYLKSSIWRFLFLMPAFYKWILVLELHGWLLFTTALQSYSIREFSCFSLFIFKRIKPNNVNLYNAWFKTDFTHIKWTHFKRAPKWMRTK